MGSSDETLPFFTQPYNSKQRPSLSGQFFSKPSTTVSYVGDNRLKPSMNNQCLPYQLTTTLRNLPLLDNDEDNQETKNS
ncbi:hypothetical protein C1H46_007454 [Malus baccata]|uniref:Uncharacterized protein n=1 Tax=Malus baccata TaxID=106549 RepID=A0A540N791_MALBA|nr:hypothetical protein C1H46_007454 [Malus baccata]